MFIFLVSRPVTPVLFSFKIFIFFSYYYKKAVILNTCFFNFAYLLFSACFPNLVSYCICVVCFYEYTDLRFIALSDVGVY